MHKNIKWQIFLIATFLPLYMQRIFNSDNYKQKRTICKD